MLLATDETALAIDSATIRHLKYKSGITPHCGKHLLSSPTAKLKRKNEMEMDEKKNSRQKQIDFRHEEKANTRVIHFAICNI